MVLAHRPWASAGERNRMREFEDSRHEQPVGSECDRKEASRQECRVRDPELQNGSAILVDQNSRRQVLMIRFANDVATPSGS